MDRENRLSQEETAKSMSAKSGMALLACKGNHPFIGKGVSYILQSCQGAARVKENRQRGLVFSLQICYTVFVIFPDHGV